ncbi:MAG TPA: fused MFS/spermidine synthase [Gaiellaceae bacterium]|nr:fused MFS/spermidine synthase [Gaiellaceae bacterium]
MRVPAARSAAVAGPLFAFVGSGCLLVVELVAARLIAPTLGVSLYTWTSVIGVVLGGVSVGNYIGGRLADRRPSYATLAAIYLVAAGTVLLVLGLLPHLDAIELPTSAPALIQVLWATAVLFLLPSIALGAPTPLLTRLSLGSVEETGRVVGRIQGAAALGSIVGTFATGFFLIEWFGTRDIVAGVAAILLILAALAWGPSGLRIALLIPLLTVVAGAGWASHSPCTKESAYYCIRVVPGIQSVTTPQGRKINFEAPIQDLYLDHLLHSEVDLTNQTHIFYGYQTLYAEVLEGLLPPGNELDSFFIGGGGYVFPRWVEANYTGRITVAEIDPDVTKIAYQQLGLQPSPRLRNITGDARQVLASEPSTTTYSAIFGDAFDDYGVPFELTTRQFDQLVSAHLKPDGVYLLNIVDGVHYDFLRSELRTLRLTFPYVGLLAQKGDWPLRGRRVTLVIVAAKSKPARRLPTVAQSQLDHFISNGHSVVLTDDYAPVDQLLAPVFAQELHTVGEG